MADKLSKSSDHVAQDRPSDYRDHQAMSLTKIKRKYKTPNIQEVASEYESWAQSQERSRG